MSEWNMSCISKCTCTYIFETIRRPLPEGAENTVSVKSSRNILPFNISLNKSFRINSEMLITSSLLFFITSSVTFIMTLPAFDCFLPILVLFKVFPLMLLELLLPVSSPAHYII